MAFVVDGIRFLSLLDLIDDRYLLYLASSALSPSETYYCLDYHRQSVQNIKEYMPYTNRFLTIFSVRHTWPSTFLSVVFWYSQLASSFFVWNGKYWRLLLQYCHESRIFLIGALRLLKMTLGTPRSTWQEKVSVNYLCWLACERHRILPIINRAVNSSLFSTLTVFFYLLLGIFVSTFASVFAFTRLLAIQECWGRYMIHNDEVSDIVLRCYDELRFDTYCSVRFRRAL